MKAPTIPLCRNFGFAHLYELYYSSVKSATEGPYYYSEWTRVLPEHSYLLMHCIPFSLNAILYCHGIVFIVPFFIMETTYNTMATLL